MDLTNITKAYGLGQVKSSEKLRSGIVHQTFLTRVETGTRNIVQNMNKELFFAGNGDFSRIFEAWTSNYLIIAQALAEMDFSTAKPLEIKGNFCLELDGCFWRVFEFIENDGEVAVDEEIAFAAAKALSQFHRVMRRINFIPQFPIPNFHNTPAISKKLRVLFKQNLGGKSKRVKEETNFLLNEVEKQKLPALLLGILHGDPNTRNFLLRDKKVIALIDFDTLMKGDLIIDIGDALRSWCRRGTEFSHQIFRASLEGYAAGNGARIDKNLAFMATKFITLELAIRYLIDYFEECYFIWDPEKFESAAKHNLSRCQQGIAYYRSMAEKDLV